jgi:hypothetical protein
MAKGPTVSTTFNAVDKMTRPMRRMQTAVIKFAAAAGAAFVTGKAAQAVQNFANAGDEIAKSARKIGVSVEALQELRFAADRSGISSEGLTTSLQKLNKNVGDLRAGTGALRTILDKTNPALAEQLKNAENNEEAFNLLVNEIANTENAMDKAALAQAAFGRAGQDVLIMAENGVEGISELREEARKYGNIISTDAAAASEKFVDSMTNVKSAALGVRNAALTPLIDKLQPLIQSMADFVAKNRDLINLKIEQTFKMIGDAVKFVVDLWESGLLPSVIAGVAAFKLMTTAMATYTAIVKGATIAQAALTFATQIFTKTNIIVLIISAVIAIIVLLIKNWDKVKAAFFRGVEAIKGFLIDLWNGLMKLLDNPFFTTIGLLFAPWLTIPALIIKHWEPIMEFFKKIIDTVGGAIGKVADFFTGDGTPRTAGGGSRGGSRGLVGRNDGTINRTETNNNSTLDVNFNNAPAGTNFRQRGRAQGITVNTGYGRATL